MDKKEWKSIEFEIINFNIADVIATSFEQVRDNGELSEDDGK